MQPTIPRRRKSLCAWPLSYRPCMSEQDTHRTRETGPYLGRLFDSSAVSPSGSNSLAGYAPAYEMINHYTHIREHEATYRRRLGWRPSKRTVIRFVPVPEDIMRHTTRRITNAASGLEVRHCGRSRGCWDGLKWRTVSSLIQYVHRGSCSLTRRTRGCVRRALYIAHFTENLPNLCVAYPKGGKSALWDKGK